ncbi:MAG: radical SAM family heme chaperone HemW [Bacteroidales bacterium]|nr:radical SAM family heme chaperone HemW [Bacteroidales bacterium]
MPGLYIHIPFCKSKCSYCDFCSVANSALHIEFLTAIKTEIEHRSQFYNDIVFTSIYFGGGTPSLFKPSYIESIIESLFLNYKIAKNAEITLEANPDDLSSEYLKSTKSLNINRLSIGLQSLDDNILKLMRRRHDSKTAINSVFEAASAGFENVSADIIYGIDGLSTLELANQLEKMLSLPITHLSAYHLGIEPGTLLFKQLQNGKIQKISEEESFNHFTTVINTASKFGFDQYEISNFAKDGKISKHNSSYWDRSIYAGFGPSAHSFNENTRAYNSSDINKYINESKNKIFSPEIESLSIKNIINETIMLGLRTTRGINLDNFLKDFGSDAYNNLLVKTGYLNKDFYTISNGYLKLSVQGLFVSDSICENLFF